MKEFLKRVLLLVECIITMGIVDAQTIVTVDGIKYSLTGRSASVHGAASGYSSQCVTIPSTINVEGLNYTVNDVEPKAFGDYQTNKNIETVELPNTILTIGYEAFESPYISKVILKEGLQSIGSFAFSKSQITEMIIPSTVRNMSFDVIDREGEYAHPFAGCDRLRTLIYLATIPPKVWVATSQTYIPNKKIYGSPNFSIN